MTSITHYSQKRRFEEQFNRANEFRGGGIINSSQTVLWHPDGLDTPSLAFTGETEPIIQSTKMNFETQLLRSESFMEKFTLEFIIKAERIAGVECGNPENIFLAEAKGHQSCAFVPCDYGGIIIAPRTR